MNTCIQKATVSEIRCYTELVYNQHSPNPLNSNSRFPSQNLKCIFWNPLNPNATNFMPNSTMDNGINMVTLNTFNPYALCFSPKKDMKYILNPNAIGFNPIMRENVSDPICRPPMNFIIAGSKDGYNIVNDSLADNNYANSEPIFQNVSLPSSPSTPHGNILSADLSD